MCGIAVRDPQIVSVARHYGVSIQTCVPADPQSKGGSEATVRVAKADLLRPITTLGRPTRASLELEAACQQWMADVERQAAPRHAAGAGDPAR